MTVKKIILLITFLNISSFAFAQGAWELGYTPIDSISESWIGKEVRIDFKSDSNDVINGIVSTFDIRKLLSNKDKITLKIKNTSVEFIEDWKLYADQGLLKDQYLKVLNEENCLIDKVIIEKTYSSKIVVKINFQDSKKCNYSCNNIVIEKNLIKGLLYRKDNY